MKKILCLIDCLGQGGAERQIISLAYLLQKAGRDVVLATYYDVNFYKELIEEYQINYTFIKGAQGNQITKLRAISHFIKSQDFTDVIAYKDGASKLCCLLKMLGAKFNLLVSERNTTQSIGRGEKVRFFLYRFADHVVPNSYSQGNFIERNFPKLASKTNVITNFTDSSVYKPAATPVCNDKIYILVVGRIARQKNVQNFLHAVSALKKKGLDFCIKWFGNVDINEPDYGRAVIVIWKELQLDDVITFYPATPDIIQEYQRCDVFCLPSIYEGFPNVVCEAMCVGKPILCSSVCDNPMIVEDGKNGLLFDPMTVDSILKALEKIILLPRDERIAMGEYSLRLSRHKFSAETFTQKYLQLLK